ncbi:hypothetical protein J3R82DRAFT_4218 [Butyriboletus roseoflavus]|nr:hypothetical protein J3R82DRAFT_4218 [Butyriboletus roseoflavus]
MRCCHRGKWTGHIVNSTGYNTRKLALLTGARSRYIRTPPRLFYTLTPTFIFPFHLLHPFETICLREENPGARGSRRGGARGGSSRGPPGPAARAAASAPPSGALPGAHVQAVGVRRSGYGTAGRTITVLANFFAMASPESNIHHYDGAPCVLSVVWSIVLISGTSLFVGGGQYQSVSSASMDICSPTLIIDDVPCSHLALRENIACEAELGFNRSSAKDRCSRCLYTSRRIRWSKEYVCPKRAAPWAQ